MLSSKAMRITKLTYVRKRGQGRVNLELADGSTLELDAELAVAHQLKSDMVLTGQALAALRREQHALEARQRLVRYLALRRKSRREAQLYLARLGFSEEAVQGALEKAAALGMIDDAGYAQAYTRSAQRSAHKGPRAIRYELFQRGVDPQTTAEAVAGAEPREVQLKHAKQAARRRAEALRRDPKGRTKLSQFLMRKGYDGSVAAQVAREMIEEGEEEDGEE